MSPSETAKLLREGQWKLNGLEVKCCLVPNWLQVVGLGFRSFGTQSPYPTSPCFRSSHNTVRAKHVNLISEAVSKICVAPIEVFEISERTIQDEVPLLVITQSPCLELALEPL